MRLCPSFLTRRQAFWGGVFVLGALFAAWLLPRVIDVSRPLSVGEEKQLGEFVDLTAAPEVAEAYAHVRQDGQVTRREASAVIEVAKAQGPGYGLADGATGPGPR